MSSAAPRTGDADGIATAVGLDALLSRGLIGSRHDFTQSLSQPRDLCTPCHAPHIDAVRPPLLDKSAVATERLPSYASIGVVLDSASLLCLSCHDGVIAGDVFTAAHSTAFSRQLGSSQLGIGGLAGHPIGVKYPIGLGTYRSAAAVTADGRISLPDGRVQCVSCHDPHNTERHDAMLVRSNDGSRLCLACHRL